MATRLRAASWMVLWATLFAAMAPKSPAVAQNMESLLANPLEGEKATPAEYEAFVAAAQEEYVRARELAETIVRKNPNSIVGHFVIGYVEREAEGNFPRSVYELEKARQLYVKTYGDKPSGAAWRWYSRILLALGESHGDLDHHEKKLELLAKHDAFFDPDFLAQRAWPLMKLRRFTEARKAAKAGIATGDPNQVLYGLNALCAIEFEAGDILASYDACRRALSYGRDQPGGPTAVDLTNFAEASRSVFKLDEAERMTLEATRVQPSPYGNPWVELADLYVRQARVAEALNALKQEPDYRMQKPPSARDADRNEARRSLATFYVVIGTPEEALRITEKAMVSPDRRAHQSRDPAQDLIVTALVDRSARLLLAEQISERATGLPFYERPLSWARAAFQRFRAWMSGRQAAKLLEEEGRLEGTFKIGARESAIMPPWLAGDVARVVGPGLVREAIERARKGDNRPGASAYYDAFAADAALEAGDEARALTLAERAVKSLARGEELLRARAHAVAAEAAWRLDRTQTARVHFETAFQIDPGIFRRLGYEMPVAVTHAKTKLAEDVADVLEDSPRFTSGLGVFHVRVDGDGTACLIGDSRAVLGCAGPNEVQEDWLKRELNEGDTADARAKGAKVQANRPKRQRDKRPMADRIAESFHTHVFAPRVDLSQADARSLDGSNRVSRDPLEGLH